MQKAIKQIAVQAKDASYELSTVSTLMKNKALNMMADALVKDMKFVISENAKDIANARENGMKEAMIDRLLLTEARIEDMALGLRQVAHLPDPIGEVISGHKMVNGLSINKIRVPLGVICCIYESRPNVTADVAGLCLKSGNASILRGGSEAIYSNMAIVSILKKAIADAGLPRQSLQLVGTTDREAIDILLKLHNQIDVIIPRGGAELIRRIVENSSVPVIETGVGLCHTFIDETADLKMATDIAFNAKVSRPSVCNAMETLLVHKDIADKFLPEFLKVLVEANVEIFGCPISRSMFNKVLEATEQNWSTEYSDLQLSVRVVKDIHEAMEHIRKFSSKHSEAIVTENYNNATLFQQKVDAATVYVNASTRFTDGFEFGFGAEIGISTQKLHARGPMGLPELTSTKYLVCGNGQIRV